MIRRPELLFISSLLPITLACGTPQMRPSSSRPPPTQPRESTSDAGLSDSEPTENSQKRLFIPASDPLIRFSGRVDRRTAAQPSYAFPGVRIHLAFSGTSLALKLKDFGGGTPTTTNYYDVSIDGGEFRLLKAWTGTHTYPLASGLTRGKHTALIVKRSESGPGGSPGAGKGTLLGFEVDEDSSLLATPAPTRLLEFIGDSITCGYGNEVSTDHPENFPFTTEGSNARKAFGSLTADALNADYLAVAYSGRGVYRNWQGFVGPTVPELYGRSLPDDPESSWDPSQTTPDAILINLGTNDLSPGEVSREAFRRTYEAFLEHLRAVHPEVPIVLLAGPVLEDGYPEGTHRWTEYRDDLKSIIKSRHIVGDKAVHYFEFEQQTGPFGEDWHPTLATHEKMRTQIVPFVRLLLGWKD